jgi:hypothetical protein
VFEDEYDTSLKLKDQCEVVAQMTCFSLILANLPISSLLSCPYSTEGMKHIISAGWTVGGR